MKRNLLLICTLLMALGVSAAPAYPGLITTTQPDGTTIEYYLHGDEYFSYRTSTDGYLLAENEDGYLEYAEMLDGQGIVPMGVVAHNELMRSINEQTYLAGLQKAEEISVPLKSAYVSARAKSPVRMPEERKCTSFTLTGSPKVLIILVSFKDKKFTTSAQNFKNMANQQNYSGNYGTGSIADYFKECSFGQFTPTFDVLGPYVLPNNADYYGKQTSSQHDQNPGQMVIDACSLAEQAGADLSIYDNDNDGIIDNVFIYFAGNNQAEGGGDNTIWPHRSSVSSPATFSGKKISDYACTSEFSGTGSQMCGIGTFCHEFSHVLGLPDFYDTDYDKGANPMGSWDLMTNGNYNNDGRTPPTHTAYERFMLKWLKPIPLTNDPSEDCEGIYHLKSLLSSNTAYIISKTKSNLNGVAPNPNEFFMLEYRKMEGHGNSYWHSGGLGQGLLITHIKYNSATWNNNKPNNDRNDLGYEIVLPKWKSTYSGQEDLFPYPNDNVYLCTFKLRNDDDPMSRYIDNISDLDSCVEFEYLTMNESLQLLVHDIDNYSDRKDTVTQFVVKCVDIDEPLQVWMYNDKYREFELRKHTAGGDGGFVQTLTLQPAPGITELNDTIDVKLTPSRVTYDEYQFGRLMVKGTVSSSLSKSANFKYRNRRPIFITTPVAYEPLDVSRTSCTLRWSPVLDAAKTDNADLKKDGAKYYLDLYSVSDKFSTETEKFEEFPEGMAEGWSATFKSYSETYKMDNESKRAAMFVTNGDTLFTKEYIADVNQISFWIESVTSSGSLFVLAQHYETGEWAILGQIAVQSSTNGVQTMKIPKEGYRRFKIYYHHETGQLAFDNFEATLSKTYNYALQNEYIVSRDTTYRVEGKLVAGEEYRFTVRATDRDEVGIDNNPKNPRYENISAPSNEVLFVAEGSKVIDGGDELNLSKDANGQYVVTLSGLKEYNKNGNKVGYSLFIYTIDGILVANVPVNETSVVLPELPAGVMYVIKYTAAGHMLKTDPYVKFYYSAVR